MANELNWSFEITPRNMLNRDPKQSKETWNWMQNAFERVRISSNLIWSHKQHFLVRWCFDYYSWFGYATIFLRHLYIWIHSIDSIATVQPSHEIISCKELTSKEWMKSCATAAKIQIPQTNSPEIAYQRLSERAYLSKARVWASERGCRWGRRSDLWWLCWIFPVSVNSMAATPRGNRGNYRRENGRWIYEHCQNWLSLE